MESGPTPLIDFIWRAKITEASNNSSNTTVLFLYSSSSSSSSNNDSEERLTEFQFLD